MIKNSTSAMPSDRIQLSNHRANTERRGGRRTGGRSESAPVSPGEAPKSCMRLILATRPARRNSYTPSACRTPLPNSDSELRNSVLVTHSGGETAYPSLPFDATPCDGRLRQRVERVTFERRATGCEHHQHRLVRGRHASTLAVRA